MECIIVLASTLENNAKYILHSTVFTVVDARQNAAFEMRFERNVFAVTIKLLFTTLLYSTKSQNWKKSFRDIANMWFFSE